MHQAGGDQMDEEICFALVLSGCLGMISLSAVEMQTVGHQQQLVGTNLIPLQRARAPQ